MKHSEAIPLPLKTIRQVAADADVNEKTALRVLVGQPVRPAGRERVLEALRARGINTAALPIFRRAGERGYGG